MESTDNTEDTANGSTGDEALGTQYTLESAGSCKCRIKAEISQEKVDAELDRNYKELISSVQIPGFRRGHVPRQLLEKRYGEEIEKDVKEILLGLSFQEVAKEKDLKVVGKPKFDKIEFKAGEALRYEVEVELQPEFEVDGYSGIQVAEVGDDLAPQITDERITGQIERLRMKFPELVVIDPSEAGEKDLFLGRYELKQDGIKLHGRNEIRFQPESNAIDGIEILELAQKVATRDGAPSFKAMVKIPVQYTEEVLRGREVELEFFLEEAKRIHLPEAGDELAKRCGAESLEDLKGRIRKELEAHRKVHVESIQEERLLDTVAAMVQFDLPEGLLEEQLKMQRMRAEFSLIQEGLPREQIDERLKKADETAAEDIRKEMKRYFILEKIAEKEKIFTTEDDVELRVALLARAYGQQARDVMAELEEGGKIDTLRAEIRHSKVRRFLLEKSSAGKAAGAEATAEATAAATAPAEAPAGEPQQGT